MTSDDDKTVIAPNLSGAKPVGETPVAAQTGALGRPRLLQRPDPGGRLGQRAAPAADDEAGTVVFADLSMPQRGATPRVTDRKTNPLTLAATPLFLTLGYLRTGRMDPLDPALTDRLSSEMAVMERTARGSGLDPEEVEDSAFVLAATVDDVMRNLPGTDRDHWSRAGMVARRFGDADGQDGAFRRIGQALYHPAEKVRRLELMLACLSLGLGGAQRNPDDVAEITRWRDVLRQTFRQVAPRDTGLSPCWHPILPPPSRTRAMPVWVAATVGALAALGLFLPLATDLSRLTSTAETRLVALHQTLPPLTLIRQAAQHSPAPAPPLPQSTQLERLAQGLQGLDVTLEVRNGWVLIRPERGLSFVSGRNDLSDADSGLAAGLAAVLDREAGPIRVVGHSDNQPLSGLGPFRTNAQLSAARARTVAGALEPFLSDPTRLQPEGRGALDPIGDNATAEGRARNRRVEILIPRNP